MRCLDVSEIQNPYVDNEDAKITFIDVILGFMHMDNADVYVTGSNSKMLSSDILLDVLASGIGSLTNPSKLANTFKSERQIGIGSETIEKYIGYFEESFLIEKAVRYDVKGRKYIRTPAKYYYTDLGLRNARLGFRQLEETHIMENVLYNDLIRRGMNVDVGVVEYNTKDADGKKIRKQLEVDFVVNQGGKRFYIQSALSIADPDKKEQDILHRVMLPV